MATAGDTLKSLIDQYLEPETYVYNMVVSIG